MQTTTGSAQRGARPRWRAWLDPAPSAPRTTGALRGSWAGLLALALMVGSGGTALAESRPSTEPDATTPTATVRKIALGVSMAAHRDITAFDTFTTTYGRAPAIWSVWSDWGHNPTKEFPTELAQQLRDRGSVPLVIWQPIDPTNQESDAYTYRKINRGDHDAYIRAWARAADAFGGRVLLRFAHEMNGFWFPWGMGRFDNNPERFKAAWKRIWGIFREEGATNVKFVWSPNAPCKNCVPYADLYPRDGYVHYVSFTSFNWGGDRWKSMVRVFRPAMERLAAVTSKGVIVSETGSTAVNGDKAAWIRDGYPAVYTAFPRIKAIVYFNLDMRFAGQPNWLLNSPRAAKDAYRAILTKPKFQGFIP